MGLFSRKTPEHSHELKLKKEALRKQCVRDIEKITRDIDYYSERCNILRKDIITINARPKTSETIRKNTIERDRKADMLIRTNVVLDTLIKKKSDLIKKLEKLNT